MTDEIVVADDDWPETQTGGEDSDCDEIVVAGEGPAALQEDDRDQDDHDLDEFGDGE